MGKRLQIYIRARGVARRELLLGIKHNQTPLHPNYVQALTFIPGSFYEVHSLHDHVRTVCSESVVRPSHVARPCASNVHRCERTR